MVRGGCVVLDLLGVALGEVRLLLQLLELGVVLRPLRPAQLLLSELTNIPTSTTRSGLGTPSPHA